MKWETKFFGNTVAIVIYESDIYTWYEISNREAGWSMKYAVSSCRYVIVAKQSFVVWSMSDTNLEVQSNMKHYNANMHMKY